MLHFDAPGLEVLVQRTNSAASEEDWATPRWLALPAAAQLGGGWAVIFGDALAVLTNGRVPATVRLYPDYSLPIAQMYIHIDMHINNKIHNIIKHN